MGSRKPPIPASIPNPLSHAQGKLGLRSNPQQTGSLVPSPPAASSSPASPTPIASTSHKQMGDRDGISKHTGSFVPSPPAALSLPASPTPASLNCSSTSTLWIADTSRAHGLRAPDMMADADDAHGIARDHGSRCDSALPYCPTTSYYQIAPLTRCALRLCLSRRSPTTGCERTVPSLCVMNGVRRSGPTCASAKDEIPPYELPLQTTSTRLPPLDVSLFLFSFPLSSRRDISGLINDGRLLGSTDGCLPPLYIIHTSFPEIAPLSSMTSDPSHARQSI